MRAALAIAALLLASAALAFDQRLTVPGVIPPLGGSGRDQLLIPDQGGVIPPPTCNGTIDLSTGCVQPMLR